MRVVRREQITEPFEGPLGELVYELIGKPLEIGGTSRHSFVHVVIPRGKSSLAHYHRVAEETYYGLAGSGHLRIGDVDLTLDPGVACLIMPGEVHRIRNDADADLEFLAISAPAWVPEDTFLVD